MGKGGGGQFCQVVFHFQLWWLEPNQDRETTWACQRGEGLIQQDDRAEKSNSGGTVWPLRPLLAQQEIPPSGPEDRGKWQHF